jgi:hypothetical protein
MLARLANGWRNQHEFYRRLAVTRDDDLFPALGGGDEFGEVGLGVVDVDFHLSRLANPVS